MSYKADTKLASINSFLIDKEFNVKQFDDLYRNIRSGFGFRKSDEMKKKLQNEDEWGNNLSKQ